MVPFFIIISRTHTFCYHFCPYKFYLLPNFI